MTPQPDEIEGPRSCGPYELAGVLDLANLVLRTLNTPEGRPARWPSIGFDYPHVFHPGNLENIRVFVRRGRVVCSVGICPGIVRTPRGDLSVGGICALATHPEYRGRGLGTRIMEDAHRKMRADGHHIGLLSTLIQDFYRKLGWESGGRQRVFMFDRGNIGLLPEPEGLEVTEDWRPRIEELNRLRLREPVTSIRDSDRFRLLMERRTNRVFVGAREGSVVAYAGISGATVQEYAGAREEVACLLRAVFDRLDDPRVSTSQRPPGQRATIEMRILAPELGEGLPGLLMEMGVPHSLGYLGMIRILDPERLFRALQIREIQIVPSDGRWRLSYRGAACTLDERELVKMVFGPERLTRFAADLLPMLFYQWASDRV
ncbi:MAG: hypothetical protein A3F84_26120 [Candidatus Handelsmanbacteria bacterium RIFCSPLOWO2_12_FULL_64_10]|uniref:N-acetyltransferase domain-containing protein n=1 Tax=Handelsmanbacteria sp. (strain RIFCSPLOWO2_12_FULL_64_10) TaxID=1817868 RepID=A0A1F6CAE7_HANXR|nr:MAG: hypothetical protein A3F84_26120 [Candidatus Handelsmanbacteria bacterium RIFCSPLOWO2_12_FULL_64_10]